MSWPANPTNGQEVTKNGVLFRYNSSSGVWNRVRQLSASLPGGGASYSNTDVASYLPTYTGNISAGNIKTDNLLYANGTSYTIASFTNDSNYATQIFVSTEISNLVNSAPSALNTLNELASALGNDASYSTTITNALANKVSTSDFTSSANTAIDNRVTKTFVDNLAVVANIANRAGTVTTNAQPNITSVGSLTSLTVSGLSTFSSSQDVTVSGTPSGTVNYDAYNGVVFDVSPTANWTANVGNIPTTNNRTTVVTFIITQGATPYVPNVFQISGTTQTIKWINGTAPTGTASKVDVISYSLVRSGAGSWTVLGQSATYG